jgi:valyl-tRNA synthetase
MSEYTEKILEFNRMVWREKKTANLSLRDPISIEVPKELELFKPDLAAMHNIRM